MMRPYVLLMAIALVAVSCADNEADDAATGGYQPSALPIAFDALMGEALTRAAVAPGELTDATLQTAGFGVFACYTGSLDYDNTSVSPNFMYNQQVRYDAGAWTYAPVKYWPNADADRITFFAYAPYEAAPDGAKCIAEFSREDDLGDPWLIYKLAQRPWGTYNTTTHAYEGGAQQQDLLYGVNATDGNPWYDQRKADYATTARLKFSFSHALACIGSQITIKMSSDLNTLLEGYSTVDVNSVTIRYRHLTSKAQLVLNSRSEPNWKPIVSGDVTTERTYIKELTTPLTLTTAAQTVSEGDGLFYIPLQVAAEVPQAEVTVGYTITVTSSGETLTGETTATINLTATGMEGRHQAIALTLSKDLDLPHQVYILGGTATEPSYCRIH